MNNVQLLLSIGVPAIFIGLGILLNQRAVANLSENLKADITNLKMDITNLKAEMNRQFDKVDSRLTHIEEDQKQFFRATGILDGRLDELSSRVK